MSPHRDRTECGTQVEEMKLLSKAEQAGLLSLAERVLTSDPGAVTSLSIPFLLASVGAPTPSPSGA